VLTDLVVHECLSGLLRDAARWRAVDRDPFGLEHADSIHFNGALCEHDTHDLLVTVVIFVKVLQSDARRDTARDIGKKQDRL
jgi:hypothetical protein